MSKTKTNSTVTTIRVGEPKFDNSVFCLTHPLNKFNLAMFNFNGFKLHKLENHVYTLPIKIDRKNSMFMIISPKVFNHTWTVFFCLGYVNDNHEVIRFNLNQADIMTTGKGLNYLGQTNYKLANKMLRYFKGLAGINKGSWHQLKVV